MSDPAEMLSSNIASATTILNRDQLTLPKQDGARLIWMEKQLNHIISQLHAMLLDIESGLSIFDIGFESEQDFEEMMNDIEAQIGTLKGQIQTLREVGR